MPAARKYASSAERQRAYRTRREAARRAELRAKNMPPSAPIPAMPSTARWNALVRQAAQNLKAVREEMEAYRDDRSEAWQESEKADAFQERIDLVEEAIEGIEAIE